MISKKKSDNFGNSTRGDKGSRFMSLETATILIANILAFDANTVRGLEALRDPSINITQEDKDDYLTKLKTAISEAAKIVSLYSFADVSRQEQTAEGIAHHLFIILKLIEGKYDDDTKATSNELMEKVWARVKDKKVVKKALVSFAALEKNQGLSSDQIRTKYYKKLRAGAPRKWRNFKNGSSRRDRIQNNLIRTLNQELGL